MAAPAYATDLTDITTSFTTNWNLISEGGGGANTLTAPETDDFIQGTSSASRSPFSTSIRGIAYNRATITVASGDAVFFWWKADASQAIDTQAGGGVRLVMGSSLTAYRQYYVAGSDTYQLGGWRCMPIDPTNAGNLDRGTPGSPNWLVFGVAYDVPGTMSARRCPSSSSTPAGVSRPIMAPAKPISFSSAAMTARCSCGCSRQLRGWGIRSHALTWRSSLTRLRMVMA